MDYTEIEVLTQEPTGCTCIDFAGDDPQRPHHWILYEGMGEQETIDMIEYHRWLNGHERHWSDNPRYYKTEDF